MRTGRVICLAMAVAIALPTAACDRVDGSAGTEVADDQPSVRADLYQCEGCEAASEADPDTLASAARIGAPDEPGEPLTLRGTVYRTDGRTPASDVVIYAYQTNADGLYAGGSNASEWSRRHGRLRGWARTDAEGDYVFSTIKPGIYPDRSEPAHIHLIVQEPGRPPYWIDDVVFEGEFGVVAHRANEERRGGGGVVRLGRDGDGHLLATRDIVLEAHPE